LTKRINDKLGLLFQFGWEEQWLLASLNDRIVRAHIYGKNKEELAKKIGLPKN